MNFGKAINHKIYIDPSGNNGFVVTVGCGVFVYTDTKQLIADLETYLANPEWMEKEYNMSQPNVTQEVQCDDPDCAPPHATGGGALRR